MPEQALKQKRAGLFGFLAGFSPLQQVGIFAVSALLLMSGPVAGIGWWDRMTAHPSAESEVLYWLTPGQERTEIRVPSGTASVTLAASGQNLTGIYRISVVDVAAKPIWSGPDQAMPNRGRALALRVPSLPAGLCYAQVERRAENGQYALVSRHELIVEWL